MKRQTKKEAVRLSSDGRGVVGEVKHCFAFLLWCLIFYKEQVGGVLFSICACEVWSMGLPVLLYEKSTRGTNYAMRKEERKEKKLKEEERAFFQSMWSCDHGFVIVAVVLLIYFLYGDSFLG